ncbi:MAG: molybdopterin-binding protein [Clostridiaceae bacterium]
MNIIKTKEAIGKVLYHDITQIVPGKFAGRAFKKGHVIREEDVEVLLSLGKDHIYVAEYVEGMLHENEAAVRLKDLTAGEGLTFGELKEGKIDFFAEEDGLLKINKEDLLKLNSLGEIILATLHNNTPVKKGEKVAGTRVIPLTIEEEKIKKAEEIIKDKIVSIIPITSKKVGIVTTGNEVYHGRIKDAFGPVIIKKVEEYGCEVIGQEILPDKKEEIIEAINSFIEKGAEMIVCTGGMSVDPDDVTPTAIKGTGADLITYGSPVLPGAMFLLAFKGDIPILGLPGCVMYSKRTIFDLMLPRILAGEKVSKEDIAGLGHGGLCMNCEDCRFPNCSFGK